MLPVCRLKGWKSSLCKSVAWFSFVCLTMDLVLWFVFSIFHCVFGGRWGLMNHREKDIIIAYNSYLSAYFLLNIVFLVCFHCLVVRVLKKNMLLRRVLEWASPTSGSPWDIIRESLFAKLNLPFNSWNFFIIKNVKILHLITYMVHNCNLLLLKQRSLHMYIFFFLIKKTKVYKSIIMKLFISSRLASIVSSIICKTL